MQRLIDTASREVADIEAASASKHESVVVSPQGTSVRTEDKQLTNFCANNYLGFANSEICVNAARGAIRTLGVGSASVRFICGTFDVHRQLEGSIARFVGSEDSILFNSCWDANTALFQVLLSDADVVLSHTLNHASIIDGVRLCKAQRKFWSSVDELRTALEECAECEGTKLIVSDGVFSMDGTLLDLEAVVEVAAQHGAVVMVDDSHAHGVVGPRGRGTPELFDVEVSKLIVTGTLGKALGGVSGGFVAAPAPIIRLLRERSRPYLFSNSLPPPIAAAALAVMRSAISDHGVFATKLKALRANVTLVKQQLKNNGIEVPDNDAAIIPIIVGEAEAAVKLAKLMRARGMLVKAFSFPVVARGKARVRVQICADHTAADIQKLVKTVTEHK